MNAAQVRQLNRELRLQTNMQHNKIPKETARRPLTHEEMVAWVQHFAPWALHTDDANPQ